MSVLNKESVGNNLEINVDFTERKRKKMEILSYVMSLGGLIADLSTAAFIKIKYILLLQLLSNLLIATSYLCISQASGAVTCIVACILIIINFCVHLKGKKVSAPIILINVVAIVVANLFTFRYWYDILAIIAGIMFVIEVSQENGKHYRKFAFFNILSWIVYNIIARAYGNLAVQVILIIINILAQKRDRKITINN